MKVTKYPQSCLVLDTGASRLLIDPGSLVVNAHTLDEFLPLDAVLYTHRHGDHFDERLLDPLRERGITLVGNADVCELLGSDGVVEVADGQTIEVGGCTVTAHDLPHMAMVDGSAAPPNTGFVVDRTFFHPGDGIDIALEVDTLALPIAGPGVSFRDAYLFVEKVGASKVVPIHYDVYPARPKMFAARCDIAEVVVLADGESADV